MWVPATGGRPPAWSRFPAERDYYLERRYPSFGNLVPARRRLTQRQGRLRRGRGVGESGLAVYSISASRSSGSAWTSSGCVTATCLAHMKITDEDPYRMPMRIYPAIHYTMGGLWVDYNPMSTIPGLQCPRRGELFGSRREPAGGERADAGTRRRLLRHSHTLAHYLGSNALPAVSIDHDAFREAEASAAHRHAAGRAGFENAA